MTERAHDEYAALRATIRERGTTRIWVFLIGTMGWAAIEVATIALGFPPMETILPLLVLAATSEAIYALHVGVERIGRYLQLFHEADAGWERIAMSFGRPAGAARLNPLFTVPLAIAGIIDVLPATFVNPTREELLFVGGAHALYLLRLVQARAVAGRQRAIDLARFEQLKTASSPLSRSTAS